MIKANSPIGVIDSGVGGLTVVAELQKLYPNENIIYYGDSANCPYGTRSGDEIVALTKNMLDFLAENDVKAVAIACNTISTQIDLLTGYDYPIVGIVSPAADMVAKSSASRVGVIATPFTIQTGAYGKLIQAHDSSIEVFGTSGGTLAALVDAGANDIEKIDAQIQESLDSMVSENNPQYIILGCTHYPIVKDRFEACYPDVTFVNPAIEQVKALSNVLREHDLLCHENKKGYFHYCTSGDPASAVTIIDKLGIRQPDKIVTLGWQITSR